MKLRNQFALLFVLLSWLLTCTDAQFRIINGQDINIERSPHSVAIFHNGFYRCVGSLVSMNSVVTVAHCVIAAEQDKFVVVAGVTDVRQINSGRGQRRRVQHIHHDCDYNPQTKFMDVAVVKVDISFEENDAVQAILLCDYQLVSGMTMKVSGWGAKALTDKVHSYLLQTAFLDIANTEECKTAYANLQYPVYLAETIICAGCSGNDVCIGDSGAAGVVYRKLCAVVQGGCGDRRSPGLFTDVTNPRVLNFIISKI